MANRRPIPTTHQALAAFRQESAKLLIFYDDAGVLRHEQAPWWLGTSLEEDGEESLELFPGFQEVEVEECRALPVRRVSEDVRAGEHVAGERVASVGGGVREESVRLVRKRERRKKKGKKRGERERGAVPKTRKKDPAAVAVAPAAPVVVAGGGHLPDLPYSSMYDRIKRRKPRQG